MAVTVTPIYPTGAVAPTLAQMLNFDTVRVSVIATADADTTATITHNMALSAAQLTAGQPDVIITSLLVAPALLSGWAVTSFLTNTIVLTKATTAGSGNAGAQIQVVIRRPHSIGA